MWVRLVQEAPGKKTDNVLCYFTPEGIVSIEKVDTFSPTAQRHALRIPFGESASTKQIVSDKPTAVNSGPNISAPISETQMSMIENTFRTAKNMFGEYGTAAFSKQFDPAADQAKHLEAFARAYIQMKYFVKSSSSDGNLEGTLELTI